VIRGYQGSTQGIVQSDSSVIRSQQAPKRWPGDLRERLERELRKEQSVEGLVEDVMEIGRHCASLPLLDRRRPDEILGYDKNGLPQ
jgi:hypothetical protein